MTAGRSITTRLTIAFVVLLLGFGVFIAGLSRNIVAQHQDETLQRLSYGLARHIVEHWPVVTAANPDDSDAQARQALLSMLMVVNPGVQAYVLDADGHVRAYIGPPGMVQVDQVDLVPVRRFLAGAPLPLRNTDPMGGSVRRLFSVAMFPQRIVDTRPPGYLYIVLDGAARDLVSAQIGDQSAWRGGAIAASVGMAVVMLLGLVTFRYMTLPLRRLARRMSEYDVLGPHAVRHAVPGPTSGDEVRAIDLALGQMTARIEDQTTRERRQVDSHREVMASLAHDLRTPLTALHGHLEALSGTMLTQPESRIRVLETALAQSDKVRRLSQQLFEFATLEACEEVPHRERFRLDELVNDAVQKFSVVDGPNVVELGGTPPGPLEFTGDLQLIERALTNLIDNALRHGLSETPVQVSVRRVGARVEILVEDDGPGLPEELHTRLERGASLRDPPIKRVTGGIGGLGLAIAQRIAQLHGGGLSPLPIGGRGTRLCMALPLGE